MTFEDPEDGVDAIFVPDPQLRMKALGPKTEEMKSLEGIPLSWTM